MAHPAGCCQRRLGVSVATPTRSARRARAGSFGADEPSMKPIGILLIGVAVVSATLCAAGTAWRYKCDSPKCGYEGNLGIGGGFSFEKATGYCIACRKFVSISWKRKGLTGKFKEVAENSTNLLEKAPAKLGTAWNAATGLTADLYPCPHCKKPFMEIDDISLTRGPFGDMGKLFCPRCTNLTLRFEDRGQYD